MRRGLFLTCILATACITGPKSKGGASTAAAAEASGVPAARIKPNWQKFLVKTLNEAGDKGVEAYGLFSEGGWADAGQVMIIIQKTGAPRLLVVQAARAKVDIDRILTDAEWQTLQPILDGSKGLESIQSEAFDALTFEFAHASKSGGEAEIDRRMIYLNVKHVPAPGHEALIKAFQDLKKKA